MTNRNVRIRFVVDPSSFPRPDAAILRDETRRTGGLRLPEPTFGTFVEGRGNRLALAAARAFAGPGRIPFRSLLIHAPSGLGKTHLLKAIAAELSRAPGRSILVTNGEAFPRQLADAERLGRADAFLKKCRSAHALLFDDLHLLEGKPRAQSALIETVLALEERGCRTAMTSEKPSRALEGFSRAARSRLRAVREVAIDRPDAPTGGAFLRACAPPGTPPAALDLIAERVPWSHKDQLACLARTLEGGAPTVAAARTIVEEFVARWGGGPSYEDIARAAAERFGVTLGELYAPRGSRAAAEARRACFYLARKILGEPFARIGRHFGGRGHAAVLQACRSAAGDKLQRLERDLAGAR